MREAGASAISAEFEFLLLCAGCELSDKKKRHDELIVGDLNWQELLRIARHHRLIPQVYRTFCNLSDRVPSDSLREIRAQYDLNVRQTLRLTRDLIRVVKHFQTRGIPVLPYKGPALATLLYGDITQRQYSDLDLLVHRSDVEKSMAVLEELGYAPSFSLTKAEQEYYLHSANEYAFHAPDAKNVLELQWNILPRFYSIDFDVAEFFDRSTNIDVCGHPIPTLCAEDLLLVLSVHAAKHGWTELSLITDILRLVESQPIDWDSVFLKARRLGIRQIVNLNFLLANELLGAHLSMVKLHETTGTTGLARRIVSTLRQSHQVNTESIPYFRLMVGLRERVSDRARFLLRLMFTPSMGEWEIMRLPPWLFPLYRLLRIYRLGVRFARFVWRKVADAGTAPRRSANEINAETVELRSSGQPETAVAAR